MKTAATPAGPHSRLLVVDDERGVRSFLSDLFSREGYQVSAVADAAAARQLVGEADFDLVFADIMMPDEDGLSLLAGLRGAQPDLPVVLITGHPSIETAIEGLRLGASDYVMKPFTPEELRRVARRILENNRLKEENERLRAQLRRTATAQIIAESPAMKDVLTMVHRIADADAPVLVTGESGVGKEGIARAIHFSGNRQDRPFVAVNCGAIPHGLVESELFGHRQGSFTGADRDKEGLLVTADRGTVLLDEIGELPPDVQPKLLRFLQTGEVLEVGGLKPHNLDVRVIACTNRNLEDDIVAGRFREDLYYRLHVIRIEVPPLRERPEDIDALARHFMQRHRARRPDAPARLSTDAAVLLRSYPWPGNVRELENAVERAMTLASGARLGREDFTFLTRDAVDQPGKAYPYEGLTLAQVESLHIRRVLDACDGNRSACARLLGIDRSTLWKKLK